MKAFHTTHNGISVIEVTMEDSDMSNDVLKQQRLATCFSCEFSVAKESCSKCSCLLANRVAYVEAFCPEGKW
jgi:hypothetical protein